MNTTRPSTMPRSGNRRGIALKATATAAIAIGLAAAPAVAANAPSVTMPGGKIYGGVDGDWQAAQARTGLTMGRHTYGNLEGSVPQGRMITFNSSANWRSIASAKPGSAIYNNMVRWANTIKSRGGNVLVAYSHEPEISSKKWMGSSTDFKAAYAKFVNIFRGQGTTNVKFVLQLTAWSYRSGSSDPGNVAKWYPGDAYVDVLGADAYNWYTCGAGRGKWVELNTLVDPVLRFAKAHNKMIALPEWGATANPRRQQWMSNAKNYLIANESWIAAAYYFNRPPTNPNSQDCRWTLTTNGEYANLAALLRDPNFTI